MIAIFREVAALVVVAMLTSSFAAYAESRPWRRHPNAHWPASGRPASHATRAAASAREADAADPRATGHGI